MSKTLDVISLDLDSTLADTRHRQSMINREGHTDWKAYSMACANDGDGPALPLARYLTAIDSPFVICSARDSAALDLTRKWLYDRGVRPWLIQLEDGKHDGYSHGMWKAKKLLEIQEKLNCRIIFHVDDWSDVAKQTAIVGIPTILVHQMGSTLVDEALG